MACQESISIVVNATPQAVSHFLRNPTGKFLDFKIKSTDSQGLYILMKTGINLVSFGEDITITISAEPNDAARVNILSKSSLSTVLVDWGRNGQNVHRIAQQITMAFPYAAPPPQG